MCPYHAPLSLATGVLRGDGHGARRGAGLERWARPRHRRPGQGVTCAPLVTPLVTTLVTALVTASHVLCRVLLLPDTQCACCGVHYHLRIHHDVGLVSNAALGKVSLALHDTELTGPVHPKC